MNFKKEREHYIRKLNLTEEGALFILDTILGFEQRRICFIHSIDEIKKSHGLYSVRCRTSAGNYWTSISDINSSGWLKGMTNAEKRSSVFGDIYHKIGLRR